MSEALKTRKIIHVDMDCFYAAIEIRDNPALANKPVAVGGSAEQRGVICTANYLARRHGVHSAMATATALRLCRELVLLPVNMAKYQAVAKRIHAIFLEFTEWVEPLALDEAYLDVTDLRHFQGSATLMAQAIRQRIWEVEQLTASAGVAGNKFLAKIASGWKKPNGLFVIHPNRVTEFIQTLAVTELHGVGKVMAEKLHTMGIKDCRDLQKLSLAELTRHFGKLGQRLYNQCRGIDHREVEPNKMRKSLSVERTFTADKQNIHACMTIINELYAKLLLRYQEWTPNRLIKNLYIKIKYNDFKLTTAEIASHEIHLPGYLSLFQEADAQENKPIRLLGLGVHFQQEEPRQLFLQESLF